MRQKIFKKQFLAIAVIVFLSLSFIWVILTFIYNNYLAEQKYDSLSHSCQSVVDFIEQDLEVSDNKDSEYSVYYIARTLANVSKIDIYVIDNTGVIQICSCDEWGLEGGCEHSGSQLDIEDIRSITSGEKNELTTLGIYSAPHFTIAQQIDRDDTDTIGYVVATDSIDDVQNLMKKITRIYIFSAIVPLALMFIAIYATTYKFTKPLKLMSDAAKAMAKGDFSKRIPVTSDDEIGQLAASFNQMTNSLARLEEVRKSFIANVSHELKTPMTTIGGFIDGIIDGTIEADKQEHYLKIVYEEIKRLSRMVETMLSVSRLESNEIELKKEPFNFKEQILNVVLSQEQRIENKQINIIGLDKIDDTIVTADKDMIYRVVYNLVDNAIKFTDNGGSIEFGVGCDAKNISFKIKNSGQGIPSVELPYVFERFYKVDKSRSKNKQSTGLGLYIVKTIIKNHGGVISVSSVENNFTSFEFTLPIIKQEIEYG